MIAKSTLGIDSWLNDFDRFFSYDQPYSSPSRNAHLPMDVVAHEDYIEVFIECAGVKKEDIKLELDSGILTISGEKTSSYETARTAERKFGKFSRKLKVPYGIEKDEITAKCEDGVLCIQLRKKEIPVEDKTISIE